MNAQAEALLSCVEARYGYPLTFEAEDKGNSVVYTANVSPTPSIKGDYTLVLPAGMFGDSDFLRKGKDMQTLLLPYCIQLLRSQRTLQEMRIQ